MFEFKNILFLTLLGISQSLYAEIKVDLVVETHKIINYEKSLPIDSGPWRRSYNSAVFSQEFSWKPMTISHSYISMVRIRNAGDDPMPPFVSFTVATICNRGGHRVVLGEGRVQVDKHGRIPLAAYDIFPATPGVHGSDCLIEVYADYLNEVPEAIEGNNMFDHGSWYIAGLIER